jgi:hypothetical protein
MRQRRNGGGVVLCGARVASKELVWKYGTSSSKNLFTYYRIQKKNVLNGDARTLRLIKYQAIEV